jgi:UDP:flavonoid glycosyltransferase YjiC (YdhE family)
MGSGRRRILATSTSGTGHFAPLVPALQCFVDRGDEVRVVSSPGLAPVVEAAGLIFEAAADLPRDELDLIWSRVPNVSRAEAAVLVNREVFGRLSTEALLPTVEEICAGWRPDLLVHEPAEFAAAVASRRLGIPHVQVAIGLAGVEASSMRIAEPVLEQYGPDFVESLLDAPYLSRIPESLDPSPFRDTRRFREQDRSVTEVLADLWGGSDDPLVYVSFGTVAGRLPVGEVVYPAALNALEGLPVRGLMTTGRTRTTTEIGASPAHVRTVSWVDQAAALDAASMVVCHGGAGTTFAALAAGKPLVIVPLMADQPTNGRIVASAGAGAVVAPEEGEDARALGARLRQAIEDVLGQRSYHEAARVISAEMHGMTNLADVVDRLRASSGSDDRST